MHIKDIRTFTDVEFVEGIIGILDHGWAIGSMCTPDGRKCLVGAGTALLGYDYLRNPETLSESHELVNVQMELQREVSLRLAKLLDIDVIYDPDPVSTITRYNDAQCSYTGQYGLRNELVNIVARLKGEIRPKIRPRGEVDG
jgi:hypothetical protein